MGEGKYGKIPNDRVKYAGCRHGKLFLLLFLLFMLLPGTRAEAATPYSVNGRLAVSGGKIVNSKGTPFVIKGVSTHGLAWYPEYVNKESFKTLRDEWGVNTVRLALYTADYNGYCTGGNKKELKNIIDQGVKYATDLGMYVIIDWHILSDGNPLKYKSQADSFFKETAKKYSRYGNVMYEICNEPNGSGGSWKNIKSYANTVIKTIRSVNKDAVIIVGTPSWSQDVDQAQKSPITGYKNIAYSFHFYAGTHKSAMRTKLEKALKNGLPVIVTEFGISEASGSGSVNTLEGDKWIKLLDQYGVGRVCWNLSNKKETCALLDSSCGKKSGWGSSDLSASGKWLVKTYTGKADSGSSPSQGSSAASGGSFSQGSSGSSDGSSGQGSSGSSGSSSQVKSKTSSGTVKINVTVKRVNSWKSGGAYYSQYTAVLKNKGSKASAKWQVSLKFAQSFRMSDQWCGSFKRNGKTLTVKPLSWNKKLKKGQTTEFGFIVKTSSPQTLKSISVTAS